MENKTSTIHENGNDANRLLPAVLLDMNERYYFKTRGQEPNVECTQRCMFRDNGICIGSAACQECEHHFENNIDEWGCISWIKCRKINEAVSKNGR
jgi:hypothetical protein